MKDRLILSAFKAVRSLLPAIGKGCSGVRMPFYKAKRLLSERSVVLSVIKRIILIASANMKPHNIKTSGPRDFAVSGPQLKVK